jgi:hypothetical protein
MKFGFLVIFVKAEVESQVLFFHQSSVSNIKFVKMWRNYAAANKILGLYVIFLVTHNRNATKYSSTWCQNF